MAAATRAERLRWEKEFLGLYLSDHPFRDYETLVPAGAVRLREAFDIGEGKEIITCGIISGIHKIFSRNGEPMYFVTCDDGTAALEIIIFPSLARQIGALLVEGTPLYIKGKLSTKEGEPKILTDIIERLGAHLHESAPLSPTIDAWKKNASHTAKEEIVQVKIPEENSGKRIEELKKIFLANPGAYKVLLYFNNGVETHRIETNMHVAFDTATKQSIERITGTGSVTLSAKTLIQ